MELVLIQIPEILIETLTINGYFRVFYRYLPEFDGNHRKTYEWLEELRETYGMPRRYDSFPVFRAAKSRLLSESMHLLMLTKDAY
jgi:hypothetical protein